MPELPGKTFVTKEFNDMCVEQKVEARVQASPNPGNPWQAVRLITFKNFNNECVTVFTKAKRSRRYVIQPKGELQVGIAPGEPYPVVMKGVHDKCPIT